MNTDKIDGSSGPLWNPTVIGTQSLSSIAQTHAAEELVGTTGVVEQATSVLAEQGHWRP
jgi:hypothetical protein